MATISKAEVISIKSYGLDTREYILKLEKNVFFESGTYLLLTLEEQEDYTRWPESRNFSIASSYNKDGIIRLIVKRVGYYTSRIFEELNIGKTCIVKYAFGDFMLPFYDQTNTICCIAGGTGISPILGFCEDLKQKNQLDRLHVFYSFKDYEQAVGLTILEETVPAGQLHLYVTREKKANQDIRRIEYKDILQNLDLNIKDTHFYICGASDFTKMFKTFLADQGSDNIYTDEW